MAFCAGIKEGIPKCRILSTKIRNSFENTNIFLNYLHRRYGLWLYFIWNLINFLLPLQKVTTMKQHR